MGWGFTRNEPIITENSLAYTIHPIGIISLCALLLLCVFTIIIFNYNKQNPDKKIHTHSLKPPEYLEEDEMYRYATMNATKKVYTFITWALPALLVLIMFPIPFSNYTLFVLIAAIIIIQNFIYFFEIRKYKETK